MPAARRSRALSCALVLMLALTALAPLATPATAVSPATIKGYLREPGGAGVKGGEVVAIATDDENYGTLMGSTTATDGAYEIRVPAGTYLVAGLADDHFGGFASGSSLANARRYGVSPGSTLTGINVTVERKPITTLSAEGVLVGPKAATRLLRKSAPRLSGKRAIYSDANQLLLSDFSSGVAQESILSTYSASSYDLGSTYAFVDDARITLASGESTQVTTGYVQGLGCDDTYVAYVLHDYDPETDEETFALDIHRVADKARVRSIPLSGAVALTPGAVANGRVALTVGGERVLVYDIATGAKLRDFDVPDPQTPVVEDASAVLAGDRLVWTDSVRAFAATMGATPATSTVADVSGTTDRVIGKLHAEGSRFGYAAWTQGGTAPDFTYGDLSIMVYDFASGTDSPAFAKPAASTVKPDSIFDISAEAAAWLDPLVALDDPWSEDWSLGEGVWGSDGGAPVRLDTVRHAYNDQTRPELAGGRVAWFDNGAYDTSEAKRDLLFRGVGDAPGSATVIESGMYDYESEMALGDKHLAYLKPALVADDEMTSELWVYAFDDARKTRIDRDLMAAEVAMDGDWLVYTAQKEYGAPTLKARDLSGSTVRTIPQSEYGDLTFLVDRGVVYYVDDLGDVWAYDLVAGTKRPTLLDFATVYFGSLEKPHFVGSSGIDDGWMFGGLLGSLDLGNFETNERFAVDPFAFMWWDSKLISGRWASMDAELLDITSGRFYRFPGDPEMMQVAALDGDKVVMTEWDEEHSSSAKVFDISSVTSPTRRVFGANRVGTSVALSQETAEATCVVIATARNFPDALAGAPLAHALKAPVLLTEPGGLSPAVAAEVQQLGAEKAYVLGSTSAVAGSVDTSLVALGLTVERLEGGNRYQTAAAIAAELRTTLGGQPLTRAFLATGRNFPDALAASAVAARMGAPILLTEFGSLPTATKDALVSMGATETIVLGAETVVSNAVLNALPTAGKVRIKGADRYDTARKVAEYGYGKGVLDADSFVFAIGNDFPDALGAGAVAAARGDALLLVNRAYPAALPSPVAALMAAKKSSVTRPSIVVGSEAALQLQLQQKISAALP